MTSLTWRREIPIEPLLFAPWGYHGYRNKDSMKPNQLVEGHPFSCMSHEVQWIARKGGRPLVAQVDGQVASRPLIPSHARGPEAWQVTSG